MKPVHKMIIDFVIAFGLLGGILSFVWGRFAGQPAYFAAEAPVKTVTLPAPFPDNLVYEATPDPTVLVGIRPTSHNTDRCDIAGFDRQTARRLWRLSFSGILVGQTNRHLLVYQPNPSSLHFVEPQTGQINRKIAPAPAPLISPSSLYAGMAFTDDLYLVTKPLYQDVIGNDQIDTSWKIGITAKTWETNAQQWFLPPVQQIVILDQAPVVSGDKALIVNAKQTIGKGHSYQIVSLKTGQEQYRGSTEGTYFLLDNDQFFEWTPAFVRRLEPFTQREIWRIEGAFPFGQLWTVGNQLTLLSRRADGLQNTLRIIDTVTGGLLCQFDVPFHKETAIKGAYYSTDKQILLHFSKQDDEHPGLLLYDYWVNYDPQTRQARWRTHFLSKSFSSLLPFITL